MYKFCFEGEDLEDVFMDMTYFLNNTLSVNGKTLPQQKEMEFFDSLPDEKDQAVQPKKSPNQLPKQSSPEEKFTLEQLSRAGSAFIKQSPENQQKLINLMQELGVPSLQDLPEDQYQAFADGLRKLGGAL